MCANSTLGQGMVTALRQPYRAVLAVVAQVRLVANGEEKRSNVLLYPLRWQGIPVDLEEEMIFSLNAMTFKQGLTCSALDPFIKCLNDI